MGLSFFRLLQPKNGRTSLPDVSDAVCRELMEAALEYQIRELCWWSCVNWVANIIGRCEVRTYKEGKELHGREYYMWNVEPNANQNSTAFWHKLVAHLFEDNEVLLVFPHKRDGEGTVIVADSWQEPEQHPTKRNEYRDVTVGEYKFPRVFYEDDVMHLRLNHTNMKPVIDGLYQSYVRLVQAAAKAYGWQNGQHWKVHVNQVAGGSDGWAESFQKMLEAQIKPFFQSNGAILPEFDGYKYEKLDGSGTGPKDTRDIKAMIEDIFDFTARAVCIPNVLIRGGVEATGDAMRRALTTGIDPICDQFSEEGTRKRYRYAGWEAGSYLRMDSSTVQHFDLFSNAVNIEKLLGSGWSLNDIRKAAGEEPINEPWANEHLVTKNIGRLEVERA
ncbi:MAG: phage portal protein [Oscillospiraceae bacterium]|nr:phage portal protein [Oscillospiraceae bacterium]